MKSHGDEVAGYYDKEIPKKDSNHTCLAVVSQILLSIKMKTVIHKYFEKSVNTLSKK